MPAKELETFVLAENDKSEIAGDYFLDDVPGAIIPASRLRVILDALAAGRPVTMLQSEFLRERGYRALFRLACGEIAMDDFRPAAKAEQEHRLMVGPLPDQRDARRRIVAEAVHEAKAAVEAQEKADQLLQDAETDKKNAIIFAAREKKLDRRRAARALSDKYVQGYIEQEAYGRVMRILRSVAAGKPIGDRDLAWLGSDGSDYWTDELRKAHHRLLAERLTDEWRQTGDPWKAVNACGHWRKAGAPDEALPMTQAALDLPASGKLRSALRTTRGGALRDLGRYDEAVTLGNEAHALTPRDYRPCTLLGAVHIQRGAYADGAKWYEKAEALGASRQQIDRELQSILAAAAPEERRRLEAFIKSLDEL